MARARISFPIDTPMSPTANASSMPGARRFIRELKEGEEFELLVSVKQKRPPRQYTGGYFFELRVSDRSGEKNLKFWGQGPKEQIDHLYTSFCPGDVLRVKGCVSKFKDVLELSVSGDRGGTLEKVPTSEIVIEEFVARSKLDPEELMSKLNQHVKAVHDKHIRAVLSAFFSDEDFVNKFKASPASMWYHSNWIGGLTEHTLKVVEMCEFLAKEYPRLDHDLLIAGALLHDVGKVREYVVSTNIDVTADGMLRGHIVIGAEMVARACEKVPEMEEGLKLKLVHMVLASHGEAEFGSPKKPQFPEALALNYADDIDAKLEQFMRIKEEANTEDPWICTKRFGPVYLR
ncbi:MAG TPA: HD domain-containing protein [Methanomassiliicoccales archaeon]|nr:HD domain-containing protein [Methanomassiliicoccales archaeon]